MTGAVVGWRTKAETVVFRPELTPALRRQVDRLASGPARYAGPIGPDFMVAAPPPVYDQDAQRHADAIRNAAKPASRAAIERWLLGLAGGITRDAPPPGGDAYSSFLGALILVCGDLPSVCWDGKSGKATLIQALGTFTFWPSIAEIKALMEPHAEKVLETLHWLEAIASADPRDDGRARKSTVPYDPGPAPPWCFNRRMRTPSGPVDGSDVVVIDPTEVARQLAALCVGAPLPRAAPDREAPKSFDQALRGVLSRLQAETTDA